MHALPTSETG